MSVNTEWSGWVQSWGSACRKWRELLPPFPVKVRELGGQDKQRKPYPCWTTYLLPKALPSEVLPTLESAPGDVPGSRHLKQSRRSKLARAAQALGKVCVASADVQIAEGLADESVGRQVGVDMPRARWGAVQAHCRRLALLLKDCPDPALAEQREITDEVDNLVELISLGVAGRLLDDPILLDTEGRQRAEDESRLVRRIADEPHQRQAEVALDAEPPRPTDLLTIPQAAARSWRKNGSDIHVSERTIRSFTKRRRGTKLEEQGTNREGVLVSAAALQNLIENDYKPR